MPSTEAQIRANRENSKKSTGPKTDEGKAVSRANAYKHGLTATKVLPELEAAEVDRRYQAYADELQPSGEVGLALVLRAATLSVRMERCVDYENAVLTERVRRAEADFEAPEGLDVATVARLRSEAGKRALFDDSKEATLARKYEAAAERGFFRCLKELRVHERAVARAKDDDIDELLASISGDALADAEFDKLCKQEERKPSHTPMPVTPPGASGDLGKRFDLPIAIGKPR